MDLFRFICFPQNITQIVFLLPPALSLYGLALEATNIGYSKAFARILEWYNRFFDVILGWADKYFINFYEFLFGIRIDLLPSWKHVFFLMAAFFIADIITAITHNRKWAALFHFFFAGVAIFVTLLMFILFRPESNGYIDQLLRATSPIFGLIVYSVLGITWGAQFDRKSWATQTRQLAPTFIEIFAPGITRLLIRSVSFVSLAAALLACPWIYGAPDPSLVVLLIIMLLHSLYWIWDGSRYVVRNRVPELPWSKQMCEQQSTKTGARIFRTYNAFLLLAISSSGLGVFNL